MYSVFDNMIIWVSDHEEMKIYDMITRVDGRKNYHVEVYD